MERIDEPNHRRVLIYKRFLYIALCAGILGVMFSAYYFMWSSVPSTIMLKAGMDQQLDFRVPAGGELCREAVEASSQSAESAEGIYIDLGRPVTVKAGQVDQYKLEVMQ